MLPLCSDTRGAVVGELHRVRGQVELPRTAATQLQHRGMDIVQAALSGHSAGEAGLADQLDRGLVVVVTSPVRESEAAHGFAGELLDGELRADDLLPRLLGSDAGEDGV